MTDRRKHASFHALSAAELEAEERLEEELAEREDVRRFDQGFAAYEESLEDDELDRIEAAQSPLDRPEVGGEQ